jgi:hypothetical protein
VREAIITRTAQGPDPDLENLKVADTLARARAVLTPGLNDADALLIEAYVTARRDALVAEALAEADQRYRLGSAKRVDAAVKDGTFASDVDPQAALFLTRILRLGLLLHRGSGLPGPDQGSWENLVRRVINSLGEPPPPG